MKKLFLIVLAVCSLVSTAIADDWLVQQKRQDRERSVYWAERGYKFSSEYMTAWSMDQKVKDIERARYWKALGYNFDPDYMTAWSMDQTVVQKKNEKSTTNSQSDSSSSYSYPPAVAENGDIRGADNDGDGRSEPVYVRGYYRKNGTYVRGHYRARPR